MAGSCTGNSSLFRASLAFGLFLVAPCLSRTLTSAQPLTQSTAVDTEDFSAYDSLSSYAAKFSPRAAPAPVAAPVAEPVAVEAPAVASE